MKVICLIILTLMLIGLISASSSERISVSVFVKAKIPENKTNSTNNYLNNYLNFSYNQYNYKILINAIVNLIK